MINAAAPEGKELKYARPEFERRFLLATRPDGPAVRTLAIEDRYLVGTRIRLRRMSILATGAEVAEADIFKLTQKVPAPEGGPGLITTMYLTRAEHAALSALPAACLRKTRLSVPPFGVDLFEGALAGLVIAEAEFSDEEAMVSFVPPPLVLAEVTRDERFTGGRVAVAGRPEIAAALGEYELETLLQ